MALRQFQAFYLSAKLGSLSKAADALDSNQSTISRQILTLEKELSASLIHHGARGVKLTPAGQAMFNLVEQMLSGIGSLGKADGLASYDTLITVVSTATLAMHYLPECVAEFRQEYPQSRVRMFVRGQMEALTVIQDGMADVGLLADPNFPSQFDYDHLFEAPMALVVPEGHPFADEDCSAITAEDILHYPLVVPRKGLPARLSIDAALKGEPEKTPPVVEVGNVELAMRVVALGTGIAVAPRYPMLVNKHPGVVFIPLRDVLPPQRVGIVKRRGHAPSAILTVFVDVMERTVGRVNDRAR